MAVYSQTPVVKKKLVQDELDRVTAGIQEKYLVYSITIPATGWTKVETGDFAGLYKQTVSQDTEGNDLEFEEGDVAMIDAADLDAERLADYNVVAETFDNGFDFYCDGESVEDEDTGEITYIAPTENITADIVVFPGTINADYPDDPADLVPTTTEIITNIESIINGKY